MYRLTLHAARRIKQRRLTVEELLAALEGRRFLQRNGLTVFCDPVSRCALLIDLKTGSVVTALRFRRSKFRRIFSGEKQHGR